jgi:hypothetical protein
MRICFPTTKKMIATAALVAAAATASSPASAMVVVQQPPSLSGGGLTSDTEVMAAFDDFVLSSAATINHVRWWGGVTHIPGLYEPLNSPITFTITVYANASIFPDVGAGPLYQVDVVASHSPTAVTFMTEFEAALPTELDLVAGHYWLSIIGHDLAGGHSFAVPFSWGDTTATQPGAFGVSATLPNGGSLGLQGVNLAFALENNPVAAPEPFSAGLLAGGLGLLTWRRRRRAES